MTFIVIYLFIFLLKMDKTKFINNIYHKIKYHFVIFITISWSQKLSDLFDIWQKCFCVMQNKLCSFWCTLLK